MKSMKTVFTYSNRTFNDCKIVSICTTGRRKNEADLNTLTNSDFIGKIMYKLYTFITCQLFSTDNLFAADLSTGLLEI